jgi:hypothetical protein
MSRRKALHVQSISEWAPACIGPYSQGVSWGPLIHMAGQIGLHPPTMTLVSGGPFPQVRPLKSASFSTSTCMSTSTPQKCYFFDINVRFDINSTLRGPQAAFSTSIHSFFKAHEGVGCPPFFATSACLVFARGMRENAHPTLTCELTRAFCKILGVVREVLCAYTLLG